MSVHPTPELCEYEENIFIRDNNPKNMPAFVEKLEGVDWSSLDGYDNPNVAYNSFLKTFTRIYNESFSLKKIT